MAEILEGLIKIVFRFFIEFVVEILIKGLGYLICRPFNKNVDPDGLLVTVVGLLVWTSLVGGGVFFFTGA